MIFLGIGFLLAFLRRYSYSSIVFCLLIGVFVTEWSLLVRGWLEFGKNGQFEISLPKQVEDIQIQIVLFKFLLILSLLSADFVSAAILISFCCVLGKASPEQLITMATIEVVFQSINDYLCSRYLNVSIFN